MEKMWAFIDQETEFELREKAVQLFSDLYFSPKMQVKELDWSNIEMAQLKFLFEEISQMPTQYDEALQSSLNYARFNVFQEAEVRKVAAKDVWAVGKREGKKKFF